MRDRVVVALITAILAGCSPTPSAPPAPATVGPTAAQGATPPATSTPSLAGVVPPVDTSDWHRLAVTALTDGPTDVPVVTGWAGGYVAVGGFGTAAPLLGWASRDGRSWTTLAQGTFHPAIDGIGTSFPGGAIIITEGEDGAARGYRSADGLGWTAVDEPNLLIRRPSDLSGNDRGVLGILNSTPYRVAFSSDGATWRTVELPATGTVNVYGVAATADGFVAVGSVTPASSASGAQTVASRELVAWPDAWWSSDGVTWHEANVSRSLHGEFDGVAAGRDGLVAMVHSGGTPGLETFWTSGHGRSWAPSARDPFGVLPEGEGMGSATGFFTGDGTRILGVGQADSGSLRMFTSLDAVTWTEANLTGDPSGVESEDVARFLARDGILFVGPGGAWFGVASG